ncbi:MAG: hypothetical protein JRJ57_00205 [Deltaproteobacteria bacterium]|nr:hypothetical protein [Deltaproteobacteria bacterium]
MVIKLKQDIEVGGVVKEKGRLLEVLDNYGRQLIKEKKATQIRSAFMTPGVRRKDGKLTTDAVVPERDSDSDNKK